MNAEKVLVSLRKELNKSYEISIGENLSDSIVGFLSSALKPSSCAVVTDSNLVNAAEDLNKLINESSLNSTVISFRAGEKSKSLSSLEKILEKMHESGLDRDSAVIAFGGGVAGDLGGLAASLFMRGISLVQVPTSLLAMVDSSIGGKTGVDLKSGKNLAGSFHQPKAVFADISFLKTLQEKEMLNGLVEAVKQSVMFDEQLFSFFEKNSSMHSGSGFDAGMFQHVVRKSCEIKAGVVQRDEFESGERMLLNYGHTAGHAIESLTGYAKYSHGEAVAIGMSLEGKIANELGIFSTEALKRQNSLLESLGANLAVPKISPEKAVEAMKSDKKSRKGEIRMVFPEEIGKFHCDSGKYYTAVSGKTVLESLERGLSE